nr:MAG: ORF1 [Torque teno midi virus]
MPFWWRRRRKPWFGRFRYRRRFQRNKTRRRRRRVPRRRNRRTYRRRRRRHYKVKRKRQKIILKQWQPESIKKCKIKGSGVLVLGAQGCQYRCYTVYKTEWTNAKVPGGGGFGCELFTLNYLYSEYLAKNNIWTASNIHRDLARYTGCEFTLFRHPHTDFVFAYDIMPPFTINKYTYMNLHPHQLLQRKRKRIILSTATNPLGKLKTKVKIKPPKQLSTKWFFQEEMCKYGLVTVAATACNFRYPWMGCCNENQIITLHYIQPGFYKHSEWAQYHTGPYNPLGFTGTQMPTNLYYYYYKGNTLTEYSMNNAPGTHYDSSVSYQTGWFIPQVLGAVAVYRKPNKQDPLSLTPCGTLRYNPVEDTGKGNKMWLTPTISGTWGVPKDEDLVMEGWPLWLMLYGYTSFLKQVKNKTINFQANMIVLQSPALYRVRGEDPTPFYPILDKSFINGKSTNNTDPILFLGKYWYPSLYSQRESISEIINCGPYVPKYNETKESTWQLNYFYKFYFKWGGSFPPIQDATNPANQNTYDVPDKFQEAIQIDDPLQQKAATTLKTWDYRRGSITQKALKRMYQNLESDTSLSTDSETYKSPKQRRLLPTLQDPKEENKEIQDCLHSLFEEDSCQEQKETTDLYKLILQQQHKQQQLKHNLLTLITDLKTKQRNILHTTGFLG